MLQNRTNKIAIFLTYRTLSFKKLCFVGEIYRDAKDWGMECLPFASNNEK